MNSEPYKLPDDFGIGKSDTLIYFYSNHRSSVKNKVVFTKNMFCLLQHGAKEVYTANARDVITSNELLMLTSGSSLMSESVAGNGKYEAVLVFFGNKTLTDFCVKYGITIRKEKPWQSVLKIYRDKFLDHYCQSLQLLRGKANAQMDELKVEEILYYILLNHPDTFQHLLGQALSYKTDIKIRQVVELNAGKAFTVEELAFLCNMSMSTFKRHFAEIYQVSPQKYFTRLRMEQAKTLLSLQKKPSEIYPQFGYENLSAFSNEFKKYAGVSPRQFQDKLD